jgi:hypothetical protein
MESSRERSSNGLKLTHDEDEGGNDDDDFGQNRPRTAATLRTFLLHFRKSQ